MISTESIDAGDVVVVRIAHGKANALDIELCRAIAAEFAELRTSAAKAVVLTGQGRIFSAGVDLIRIMDGGASYIREFLPELNRAFEAVFFHPVPVVAAINGHAIAGGCVLAGAADRRLMADGPGRAGVTELLVGVPFPALAFEIMRLIAAPQFFHDVMYSGATYPPNIALTRGLVDEVVDADDLLARAIASARMLAALPREAFSLTKRQSRDPVVGRLRATGRDFDAEVEKIWIAPEAAARIRDYVVRTFKKA